MMEITFQRPLFTMSPFGLFIVLAIIANSIPSASSLVCFYCSEHYLTCETYQRYQNCQPNEDRCYILRSSDQVMQGCGQSFLAYCNTPGVCFQGDLSNCFGRQCPFQAGAERSTTSAPRVVILALTIFMTSYLLAIPCAVISHL